MEYVPWWKMLITGEAMHVWWQTTHRKYSTLLWSKNQSKTLNVTNKQQQKIFLQLFLLIRNKFYSSEHAKNL